MCLSLNVLTLAACCYLVLEVCAVRFNQIVTHLVKPYIGTSPQDNLDSKTEVLSLNNQVLAVLYH